MNFDTTSAIIFRYFLKNHCRNFRNPENRRTTVYDNFLSVGRYMQCIWKVLSTLFISRKYLARVFFFFFEEFCRSNFYCIFRSKFFLNFTIVIYVFKKYTNRPRVLMVFMRYIKSKLMRKTVLNVQEPLKPLPTFVGR